MKYVISMGICLFVALVIFICGVKVGKMIAEKLNNDKVIEATVNTKDDTQGLKKELSELRKKLKDVKNEECSYILSYPVRARCLSD